MSEGVPVSPFEYLFPEGLVLYKSTTPIPIYGAYLLKGYTVPGLELCVYWPKWECDSTGIWYDWIYYCYVSDWKNWCCCWTTPDVPVFPDLNFFVECDFSITVNVTLENFQLSLTAPEIVLTPYVIINPFTLTLGVNDVQYNIDMLKEPFKLGYDEEFGYETRVTLPSYKFTLNAGFDYTAYIYFDIDFDLYPEYTTWTRIPVNIDLTVEDLITGATIVSYTFTFDGKIVS